MLDTVSHQRQTRRRGCRIVGARDPAQRTLAPLASRRVVYHQTAIDIRHVHQPIRKAGSDDGDSAPSADQRTDPVAGSSETIVPPGSYLYPMATTKSAPSSDTARPKTAPPAGMYGQRAVGEAAYRGADPAGGDQKNAGSQK